MVVADSLTSVLDWPWRRSAAPAIKKTAPKKMLTLSGMVISLVWLERMRNGYRRHVPEAAWSSSLISRVRKTGFLYGFFISAPQRHLGLEFGSTAALLSPT